MIEREGRSEPFMVSDRGIVLALVLSLAVGLVFGLAPGLDLAAADVFYAGNGQFVGATRYGRMLRLVFEIAPFAILAAAVLSFGLRRAGRSIRAPTGRGLSVLVVSLILGPGLLVNVALKDHWHRPRPMQVDVFGGKAAFSPFERRDGACLRNCSFVSGEEASSFWSVAPALMAPPAWRAAALAAALLYAVAAGLLRMAFGGHFLSDTLFAALFTWLVIAVVWRAVLGRNGRASTDR